MPGAAFWALRASFMPRRLADNGVLLQLAFNGAFLVASWTTGAACPRGYLPHAEAPGRRLLRKVLGAIGWPMHPSKSWPGFAELCTIPIVNVNSEMTPSARVQHIRSHNYAGC